MPTFTKDLVAATLALSLSTSYTGVDSSRASLVTDVRSRAREIHGSLFAGAALTPMQVEYIKLLRSRLGDYLLAQLPAVKAFNAAWGAAWDAGN